MKIVLIVLLCIGFQARAEIREVQSIRDIEPEITDQTLYVTDLDSTVMETVQALGSDQWLFYYAKQLGKKNSIPEKAAFRKAIVKWFEIQKRSQVRLVEKGTSDFLSRLQSRGIRVLGLTARSGYMSDMTNEQLERLGVDLKKTSLPGKGRVPYIQGILYTDEKYDKGTTLVDFLKMTFYKPAKIVFVDDRKVNVEAVEKALSSFGVPHIEFRYGATDARVKAFDPDVVDLQLKYFDSIVSDEDAKKTLTCR